MLLSRRMLLLSSMVAMRGLRAQKTAFDFVLILLGPPAAGKTTQAKRLSKRYDVKLVSIPALLKQSRGKKKIKKGDPLAAQIERGQLVSDAEANDMLKRRLQRGDLRPGFILDGYPTTVAQADFLSSLLKELGYSGARVVHLVVSDSAASERSRQRGRADDDPSVFEAALADYRQQEALLRERYKGRTEFIDVDASGSEEQVAEQIRTWLDLP